MPHSTSDSTSIATGERVDPRELFTAETLQRSEEDGRRNFWALARGRRPPIRPVAFDAADSWGVSETRTRIDLFVTTDFRLRLAAFAHAYLQRLPALLALDDAQFLQKVKVAEEQLATLGAPRSTAATGEEQWAVMVGSLYLEISPARLRAALSPDRFPHRQRAASRGSIYEWTKDALAFVLTTLNAIASAIADSTTKDGPTS